MDIAAALGLLAKGVPVVFGLRLFGRQSTTTESHDKVLHPNPLSLQKYYRTDNDGSGDPDVAEHKMIYVMREREREGRLQPTTEKNLYIYIRIGSRKQQ